MRPLSISELDHVSGGDGSDYLMLEIIDFINNHSQSVGSSQAVPPSYYGDDNDPRWQHILQIINDPNSYYYHSPYVPSNYWTNP